MKLRALTLENVRKFGGKRVEIGAIGDGITVICEANEFGKSTFFDAIHAVVFEKHTATGKSVQSLRPMPAAASASALEVEIDGACYAIEKRFLAQKGASVTDTARGTVIARDGEAEDWIARHVGASEQGPAGLLWVRQGVSGAGTCGWKQDGTRPAGRGAARPAELGRRRDRAGHRRSDHGPHPQALSGGPGCAGHRQPALAEGRVEGGGGGGQGP